jgi:hypothetical protein
MSSEAYKTLVETLTEYPEVTQSQKSGFGSGLRKDGKVFAMLVKGKLCVKLPEQLVEEVLVKGEGELYMSGGRPTKDWVLIDSDDEERWLALANSAMDYVSTKK